MFYPSIFVCEKEKRVIKKDLFCHLVLFFRSYICSEVLKKFKIYFCALMPERNFIFLFLATSIQITVPTFSINQINFNFTAILIFLAKCLLGSAAISVRLCSTPPTGWTNTSRATSGSWPKMVPMTPDFTMSQRMTC